MGQAHSDLDGLFDAGHRTWSFVPQLTLPIFAGGANIANLDLSNVRKRIEVARYEKSIQSAFPGKCRMRSSRDGRSPSS